jgi:hypothetical protein
VSPRGEAVSVGGADSSVGLAQVTTEWPDSWSRLRSGAYHAEVDVSLAALSGSGTWTVFLMNAWSLSERVQYDLSIGFRFQGRPDYKTGGSCSPTARPTPIETSTPTFSMAPTSAPTPISEGNAQYVIPIAKVALGVYNDGKELVQDKVMLHTFNFTGSLSAIELHLDPYHDGYQTRGTDAWLLAVAVTDPWGLVAQVGGSGWKKNPDGFYRRNWPDPWLGRFSEGKPWIGTRDVHAAGLANVSSALNPIVYLADASNLPEVEHTIAFEDNMGGASPHYDDFYIHDDEYVQKPKVTPHTQIVRKLSGAWSVEIAIGYPWTIRSPVNYSGSVILHFTDTKESGTIMAFPVGGVALDGPSKDATSADKGAAGDSSGSDSSKSDSGSDKSDSGDGVSEGFDGSTLTDAGDQSTDGTPYQVVNPVVWFFLAFILILIFASTIFLISRLMSYKFRNSSSDEGSRLMTVALGTNIAHTRGRGIYGDAVEIYPQRAEESSLTLLPPRQYGSVDA